MNVYVKVTDPGLKSMLKGLDAELRSVSWESVEHAQNDITLRAWGAVERDLGAAGVAQVIRDQEGAGEWLEICLRNDPAESFEEQCRIAVVSMVAASLSMGLREATEDDDPKRETPQEEAPQEEAPQEEAKDPLTIAQMIGFSIKDFGGPVQ